MLKTMKKIIKNKLKHGTSSSLLIVAILISTLQSCVKDNFQINKIATVQWDPNVAAPLVYSSLSIKDMLNNTGGQALVVEAADKSLTLVYKSSLFSMNASDLVNLPDQTLPFSAPIGAALPVPFNVGSVFTVNNSQTVPFGSGVAGPLIDSITYKAGIFVFSFASDLHNSGSILITIPKLKKKGIAFSKILPLNYTNTVPVLADSNYDLTGYDLDLTQGGAPYNQFVINYAVTFNGSTTAASNSDQIAVSLSMVNMQFSKLFGYIGQQDLSIPSDTIDLSVFTNAAGAASFTLKDPTVKVTISNSYGMPIDFRIPVFEGYNPGVNFYPITGLPSPIPIHSPNINQVGQILVDSFSLNTANGSNIATIINNTPKKIVYKVDAHTNPAGATQHNFIIDSSQFKMDVEFDLPLYGTAKNFLLVDSIPFTFSQSIPDQVQSGLIRTYNSNGFPMDIDLQVYFVDSLYNVLDSLVSPNQILLKSGVVNATTGLVTSPTSTIFDATVDKARLLKLKNAKNLVIKAIANTTNSGATDVKIYSDYKLDFKLGVQVQMHVQIKR